MAEMTTHKPLVMQTNKKKSPITSKQDIPIVKKKERAPVVYGYLRVSTERQDIENFRNWVLRKANELQIGPVVFIEDTVSGRKPWTKRKLGEYFNQMVKGDTIITFEISRLGRDFRNTISFISECDNKGVKIYAGDIQTSDISIESNMKIFMKTMTAQQERDEISRRTKEALARKKAAGVKLGRPPRSDKLKAIYPDIDELIKNALLMGVKKKAIANKYSVSRETLRKYIRANNLDVPKEKTNNIVSHSDVSLDSVTSTAISL